MPVNQDLIDLAEAGDEKAVLLMMKWGYEGSKAFIGGNPVKKIVNSARDIREVLAVDLNACNNYKNGENAIKKINCPTFCIFGGLDKMVPVKVGLKMSEQITNSKTKGNSYYGLAIGFTIMAAAFAGGKISGGAFNPAVGTGPILIDLLMGDGNTLGSLWYYLVGPITGGVLASYVYKGTTD